jgi:hypothetical protein
MLVSKNLHFNVSWFLNVLLDKHMIITEALHALSFGSFKLIKEL